MHRDYKYDRKGWQIATGTSEWGSYSRHLVYSAGAMPMAQRCATGLKTHVVQWLQDYSIDEWLITLPG